MESRMSRGGGVSTGEITIAELVRNGTMSAAMAATLWAAAEEQVSFLVAAVPRNAGMIWATGLPACCREVTAVSLTCG